MTYTVPTENIVTLEQLAKTLQMNIEAKEGTMISLDSDIVRLKKAVKAEEYTLGELNKSKIVMEQELSQFQDVKASKDKELLNIQSEIDIASAKLAEVKLELGEIQSKTDDVNSTLRAKEDDLVAREGELVKKNLQLDSRIAQLVERETEVSDKMEIIKHVASKL